MNNDARNRAWHVQDTDGVVQSLQTTDEGLTNAEAQSRLGKYGPNRLP